VLCVRPGGLLVAAIDGIGHGEEAASRRVHFHQRP
jgi:hypothetical protein